MEKGKDNADLEDHFIKVEDYKIQEEA